VRVFHQNEIVEPLLTKYLGDDDLGFKGKHIHTQDGFILADEEYLKKTTDHSINNYTNFVLTDVVKNQDIFEFNDISYKLPLLFSSTIKFKNNKFLRLGDDNNVEFVDKQDRKCVFEINLLTDTLCQISLRDGFDSYYLNYDADKFIFSSNYNFTLNRFSYIKNKNDFYFFKRINGVPKITTTFNDQLTCLDESYINNEAKLNFYIQEFSFNSNSSWASYEKFNKNELKINKNKSLLDCSNNILIYNNYTYISGSDIQANFLTLKNHHTNKNYSYRADNLEKNNNDIPNIKMREYNALDTGLNQELGFDSIVLSYDTYNSDYVFKADRYTTFEITSSTYPFEQLNINDSLFFKNGAIAGSTPYHADKIFFKDTRKNPENAKYLCTWLSGTNENAIWVDRYYYPEKCNLAASLSTFNAVSFLDEIETYLNTTLAPSAYYNNFIWQTNAVDETNSTPQKIKDAIWGEYFFDKASDVILLPDQEYVYQRLGEKYAEEILKAISDSLISDGLSSFRRYDGFEFIFDEPSGSITYEFTGNEYSIIDGYRKINDTNEFTLAFTMNSYDWTAGFGNQIMGSFNDRGFGIFSDEKITPFIMVQEGRMLNIYNTDFVKLDSTYLSQDELDMVVLSSTFNNDNITTTTTYNITTFAINDVIRTDHLNFFSPTIKSISASRTDTVNAIINRRECGILYTDEKITSRILSPNNVFAIDGTAMQKIQIEQCKFKTRFKSR
jgi:hypothetical protein